jgi:hypothetical protein
MMVFPKPYADAVARLRVPSGFLIVIVFAWFSRPTPISMAVGIPLSLLGLALRAWAAGCLAKNRELATGEEACGITGERDEIGLGEQLQRLTAAVQAQAARLAETRATLQDLQRSSTWARSQAESVLEVVARGEDLSLALEAGESLRIVREDFIDREDIRLAPEPADAFDALHEFRKLFRFDALQFLFGRAFSNESRQFLVHEPLIERRVRDGADLGSAGAGFGVG